MLVTYYLRWNKSVQKIVSIHLSLIYLSSNGQGHILSLNFLMHILVQRVSELTSFYQLCGKVSVNLRAQVSMVSA